MTITLLCPHCSRTLRVEKLLQGRVANCPRCSRALLVPSLSKRKIGIEEGKKFAHYRIEAKLADGLLTTVYQARNLRLQRRVVLKVLSKQIAADTPHVADRFVSTARSAASLDHPNILPVYFVGSCEDTVFVEMQYADAGTLHGVLSQRGRLDEREAAGIIRDAALGLAAAWKKQTLHHAVKPGNLMRMGDGTVKVADFGLSMVQCPEDSPPHERIPITQLHYFSPELLEHGEIDHRSDIYSLGATFFELLTGHPIFDAPSQTSLLRMLSHGPAPSPNDYVPGLSNALCTIIARMTAPKPHHRYASYDKLIKDLNAFLGAEKATRTSPIRSAGQIKAAQTDALDTFTPRAQSQRGAQEKSRSERLASSAENGDIAARTERSDRILSGLVLGDLIAAAGAPIDPNEIARESAKLLRQARTKRFTARFSRVAMLAVLAAIGIGCLYGLRFGAEKLASTLHARREAQDQEERLTAAARLAETGHDLELRGNWKDAVRDYRESLAYHDDASVRERLNIVLSIFNGIELEQQQKWGDAERVLSEVLPKTFSKAQISRRIERVKLGQTYESTYAGGKTAYDAQDWPRAVHALTRAGELAVGLHITSDANALAGKAKGRIAAQDDQRTRMERLLDTCKRKGDVYAYTAACEYYRASPQHTQYSDALRIRLEEAEVARSSMHKDAARAPVSQQEGLYDLKLKNGGLFRGKLAAQSADSVTLDVVADDKATRRLFHAKDILSLEPIVASDINARRAEQIYGELMEAFHGSRPFTVLRIVGELQMKFADTSLVRDAREQKQKFGTTIEEALHRTIPVCESMCAECEGAGTLVCPRCEGKGERTVPCKTCESSSRLPLCSKCRGSGLRLTGICPVCNGDGRITCKRCSGKGCTVCQDRGRWECTACGGKGKTFNKKPCLFCRGEGKIDGKACPKCFGKGMGVCLTCRGTGRQSCPDCSDTRNVTIPCDNCGKSGRISCSKCKATGKGLSQ